MLLKQMLKMESFTISRELCDSFILPEIDFLVDLVKPLANLRDKVYGIYMWFCLLGALFICLNLKNLSEENFKPTLRKALLTAGLMVWSIVSFAGVSTFLYFNF